jgi:hypothetical protein
MTQVMESCPAPAYTAAVTSTVSPGKAMPPDSMAMKSAIGGQP